MNTQEIVTNATKSILDDGSWTYCNVIFDLITLTQRQVEINIDIIHTNIIQAQLLDIISSNLSPAIENQDPHAKYFIQISNITANMEIEIESTKKRLSNGFTWYIVVAIFIFVLLLDFLCNLINNTHICNSGQRRGVIVHNTVTSDDVEVHVISEDILHQMKR